MNRIVAIGAGKTGGHLFPAIRIEETLAAQGFTALYFTEGVSLEKEILIKNGKRFMKILCRKFPSADLKQIAEFFFYNMAGLLQCLAKMAVLRPAFTFITGGYASFPLGLASILTGIPLFTYDGNVNPGKVNRLLAFAARMNYGPKRTSAKRFVETGSPVRNGFRTEEFFFPVNKNVLVTGGSQGSAVILDAVLGMIKARADYFKSEGISFHIATGMDKTVYIEKFAEFGFVKAVPFIHDMPAALKESAIVISRAGAMSMEENMAASRYAVYIPFSHAAQNHQYYNAVEAGKLGAGTVITEDLLDPGTLFTAVSGMLGDMSALRDISKSMRSMYEKRHAVDIAGDMLRRVGL